MMMYPKASKVIEGLIEGLDGFTRAVKICTKAGQIDPSQNYIHLK